jgi:hypothetical protein
MEYGIKNICGVNVQCFKCFVTQSSTTYDIKVSCAGLLSSAWYGNTALPQCMLRINGLRASCWFDCIQPL